MENKNQLIQYQLINPSDPYTFLTPDLETAALTVFCLGTMYGAEPQGKGENVPVFLFGGAEEWYEEKFGRRPEEGIKEKWEEVANALLSYMFGRFEDRRRYEAALEAITDEKKKEKFINEWQDGHGSMNNIGMVAHKMGQKMLEQK